MLYTTTLTQQQWATTVFPLSRRQQLVKRGLIFQCRFLFSSIHVNPKAGLNDIYSHPLLPLERKDRDLTG